MGQRPEPEPCDPPDPVPVHTDYPEVAAATRTPAVRFVDQPRDAVFLFLATDPLPGQVEAVRSQNHLKIKIGSASQTT